MKEITFVRGDRVTLRDGSHGNNTGEFRSYSPNKMYAVVAWDYGRLIPTYRTHAVADLMKAE